MKLLAMDSSALVASVAIIEDDVLAAEYTVNHKKTHSQTLMGMLDEIVKMTELDMASIDAIAVAKGPGSFTGLRIGSATVKGLAMALDKPVVAVPTLDALAYNMWGCSNIICPIMDARRSQVYTGCYTFEDGELVVLEPQQAIDIRRLASMLNEKGREVIFLGDGVPVYADIIKEEMKVPYSFAPAMMNRQRAASVGALGAVYFSRGISEDAASHVPVYLRQSQAEREKSERESNC